MICRTCKIDKTLKNMIGSENKKRNICKQCHAEYNKKWYKNNKDKARKTNLNGYKKRKEINKNLESWGDEVLINWVKRNKIRYDLKSKEKRNLSQENLIIKAKKARELFSYITFRQADGPKAFLASIDRIDSNLGYTEENTVVVPLWFNSAKLDLAYDELLAIMETHLECKDFEEVYGEHFCKQS